MKKLKNILYIIPLAFAISCAPEFDSEVVFTPGDADFKTFVSVGNSLTSGYQSGALRRVRQENSLPAILAKQFEEIGGGEFKQPLMAEGVGVGSSGGSEVSLGYVQNCKGETELGVVGGPGQLSALLDNLSAQGPFNNVGVPGAKSFHLGFPGYENLNPFYKRFAVAGEPVINAAIRANPTFFSLWIGANDVLGYALAGGEGTDQTGNANPLTYGLNDITDPTFFDVTFNQLVDALTSNGAKGVVANIPDVTSVPHFSAISRDGLEINADQAAALNMGYTSYNAGLDTAAKYGLITAEKANSRKIHLEAGKNRWIVEDKTMDKVDLGLLAPGLPVLPYYRQLRIDELVILTTPSDSLQCFGMGSQFPLKKRYYLSTSEITKIQTATDAYNRAIKKAADRKGLAFVDANKIMSEMEAGLVYNGVSYSATFVTGGVFSMDGFHPNTRGYAIIANAFIDAINEKYGAKIRKVDVNSYEGIIFP